MRKDNLHIPYEKLVVNYEGHEVVMINKALLVQQNCWENLEAIKEMHFYRIALGDVMCDTRDSNSLKYYDSLYTGIEFTLQYLWGFPHDKNYHRFWDRPRCKCPGMDNSDRYPTGYYVINHSCPLHWK